MRGRMLLFVSGPYSGDVDKNIEIAEKVAIDVWEAGHTAFCPHLNTAHFEEKSNVPYERYLAGCLETLVRCDAIVMVPGWEDSPGAKVELDFASSHGIPVYVYPDLPPTKKELRFISVEGDDFSGGTVQTGILCAWLRQFTEVVRTQEPINEARDLVMKRVYQDSYVDLFNFMAGRSLHVRKTIYPALQGNKTVICDRFDLSSMAYQGAAQKIGMANVKMVNEVACQGIKPSLTIWLDVSPDVRQSRALNSGRAKDRYDNFDEAFHLSVRNAYSELQKADPDRIVRIDGDGTITEVATEIRKAVSGRFSWAQPQP
jgi:dTMP kinase